MKKEIVLSSAVLFAAVTLAASTYYVDGRPGRGNDSWDGESPETAKATIQAAVDLTSTSGDTVLVAPARYVVTRPITNSVAKKSFRLIAQSGDPRATLIDGGGVSMCVYFAVSGNTLAGFTITNGYADVTSGFGTVGGAGIRLAKGSTVSNCVVTCCRSVGASKEVRGGGVLGEGGGNLYQYDQLVVENCSILSTAGNKWLRGGGLYTAGPGYMRSCVVRNCALKMDGGTTGGESAVGGGAYIEANQAGGLKVVGCQFVENVIENTASDEFGNGGGLYMTCADVEQDAQRVIGLEDSLVAGNQSGYYGAGLYIYGVVVSGITVSNNVSVSENNYSAGVYAKRSAAVGADCAISSSVIVDNTSKNGGAGIYLASASVVSNCVFRGNNKHAIYALGAQERGIVVTHCCFEKDIGGELAGQAKGSTVTDCTFDDVGLTGCSPMINVTTKEAGGADYLAVLNCRFANFRGSYAINLGAPTATSTCLFDACTFANITNTSQQTLYIKTANNAENVILKNLLFAGTSAKAGFANPDIPAAFDDFPENVIANRAVALSALRDPAAGDFRPNRSSGVIGEGVLSPWMKGALDMGTGTFAQESLGAWGVNLVKNEAHERCVDDLPDIGCCEYLPGRGLILLIK